MVVTCQAAPDRESLHRILAFSGLEASRKIAIRKVIFELFLVDGSQLGLRIPQHLKYLPMHRTRWQRR